MLKLQFRYQTQGWDEMFHPAASRQSRHFLEFPWKTDELFTASSRVAQY